jgi:hypothetical protein
MWRLYDLRRLFERLDLPGPSVHRRCGLHSNHVWGGLAQILWQCRRRLWAQLGLRWLRLGGTVHEQSMRADRGMHAIDLQ